MTTYVLTDRGVATVASAIGRPSAGIRSSETWLAKRRCGMSDVRVQHRLNHRDHVLVARQVSAFERAARATATALDTLQTPWRLECSWSYNRVLRNIYYETLEIAVGGRSGQCMGRPSRQSGTGAIANARNSARETALCPTLTCFLGTFGHLV